MAELQIDRAEKSFGETQVLKDVSLEVGDGEFCVIVGPSGCGKSTLLRAIAGLEELDRGSISIGGKQMDGLPPAKRGIAMVFQSYALYPHLNLRENLAFALRLAKKPKAEIDEAVDRAATILGIEQLLDRKPAALSGGSASAWRLAEPSFESRTYSCSTNLCPTWTPHCAFECGSNSPPCIVS